MNKKGNLTFVFATVIVLIFFGFFYLFMANFMVEIGDSYIMPTVHNVSLNYANQTNLSNTTIALINNARTDYTTTVTTSVPYDLYYLIAIFSLFAANIISSIKTRKYGYFSFFGFVGVGLMFVVALIAFLEQVRLYLMNNFFYAIFGTPAISTPLIDWFNSNMPLVGFVWIVVMLLINQFDSDILNRNQGRFEE